MIYDGVDDEIIEDTHYCYDGDQVIHEYDGEGELLRWYIYGAGIDEPVALWDMDSMEIYYYHYDGLGSVVALSNAGSGEIVEQYTYDVFGEPNRASGIGNPYMFTGRRYENGIGLYYYRARYYNPEIGRFMSPDSIGYYDSLNLYQYCLNNPVNWTDPWGLNGGFGSPYGGAPPVTEEEYEQMCRIIDWTKKSWSEFHAKMKAKAMKKAKSVEKDLFLRHYMEFEDDSPFKFLGEPLADKLVEGGHKFLEELGEPENQEPEPKELGEPENQDPEPKKVTDN